MSDKFPTLLRYGQPAASSHPVGTARTILSFRVAIAQVRMAPTRIEENERKIIKYIGEAEAEKADLVVFSELALPGYASLDNYLRPEFIEANLVSLGRIITATKGMRVGVVLGFVDRSSYDMSVDVVEDARNSAAIIQDGKLLQIVDKTQLPDYDIFWERRYFNAPRGNHPVELNGCLIGVEICEDLWKKDSCGRKVADCLVDEGAQLLVNISASPFHFGKVAERAALIRQTVDQHHVPFVYANLIGGQDSYQGEVLFDGRSLVFNKDGELIALGKSFEEELKLVDVFQSPAQTLPTWEPAEEIFSALVMGIRDYFARCGFKRAYIGLSGGIDSALTAALTVEALGKENVIGVTMPSHITSNETLSDAARVARNLGIVCHERPIVEQYRAWEREALQAHGGKIESLTKQNVQARLRGQILMEYSNQDCQGIVVTTGNKTELALGYCTLYGDMCGGLAAISDVSKTVVYALARYINQRYGRELIPQSTIDRVPTAELEPGQTDEANLPAPYTILSPLVDEIVSGAGPEELYEKYDRAIVDKTVRLIHRNEYKRRQAAPGLRVTSKAFGAGRRLPIDNQFP